MNDIIASITLPHMDQITLLLDDRKLAQASSSSSSFGQMVNLMCEWARCCTSWWLIFFLVCGLLKFTRRVELESVMTDMTYPELVVFLPTLCSTCFLLEMACFSNIMQHQIFMDYVEDLTEFSAALPNSVRELTWTEIPTPPTLRHYRLHDSFHMKGECYFIAATIFLFQFIID